MGRPGWERPGLNKIGEKLSAESDISANTGGGGEEGTVYVSGDSDSEVVTGAKAGKQELVWPVQRRTEFRWQS